MKIDGEGFVEYESGDPIWLTIGGVDHPGEVTDPRDGYELEVVYSNVATTAHITELSPR